MSAPLQIKPDTAEFLADQAKARALSVDEYLRTLLGVGSDTERAAAPEIDDFMAAMESLAEENIEPLPRNFSREDIYFS
jgi:hypothetical protein